MNLTFWNGLTGPDRPAVEKLVSSFNASQTGVHVTMDIEPWDTLYQKLLPAFQAGTGPDLATRHRSIWHDVEAEDLAGTRDFLERATALPDFVADRERISRALDRLRPRRRSGDGDS